MNEYREQKDKLEYEALMRNPETAYLASDEEFDRQLDELGWSPSDMVTMTGMYMDRAAYNIKKSVRDWFRELLELMFAAAALIIDTLRTFFLVVLSILGPIAFAFSVWDGFHSTLSATRRSRRGSAATYRFTSGFRCPTCSAPYWRKSRF